MEHEVFRQVLLLPEKQPSNECSTTTVRTCDGAQRSALQCFRQSGTSLPPNNPSNSGVHHSELVSADVDGFNALQSEIPKQIRMTERHHEGACTANQNGEQNVKNCFVCGAPHEFAQLLFYAPDAPSTWMAMSVPCSLLKVVRCLLISSIGSKAPVSVLPEESQSARDS